MPFITFYCQEIGMHGFTSRLQNCCLRLRNAALSRFYISCKPIASLLRQPSEACILKSTLYINLQIMLNFMSILYVYFTIGSQVISHKKLANQVEYEKNNRLWLINKCIAWSFNECLIVASECTQFFTAYSFWLNFCTSLSFFLFSPGGKKRKKDELVQKFS